MLSHRQIMWQESWPNLLMKMRDMPYYHYKGSDKKEHKKKDDNPEPLPGTVDILKTKFAKYVER